MKEREGKLSGQIKEARKLIEQLEADKALAIAEAKQQMHGMMEGKDDELTSLRSAIQQLKQDNESLQAEINRLQQTGSWLLDFPFNIRALDGI